MPPIKLVQIVLGILLFVVVGVFAVLQQVRVVQLGYELHAAVAETTDLEEANRQLKARIAKLRNPTRLADIAGKLKLNIVPPEAVPDWSASPSSLIPGARRAESEAVSANH